MQRSRLFPCDIAGSRQSLLPDSYGAESQAIYKNRLIPVLRCQNDKHTDQPDEVKSAVSLVIVNNWKSNPEAFTKKTPLIVLFWVQIYPLVYQLYDFNRCSYTKHSPIKTTARRHNFWLEHYDQFAWKGCLEIKQQWRAGVQAGTRLVATDKHYWMEAPASSCFLSRMVWFATGLYLIYFHVGQFRKAIVLYRCSCRFRLRFW